MLVSAQQQPRGRAEGERRAQVSCDSSTWTVLDNRPYSINGLEIITFLHCLVAVYALETVSVMWVLCLFVTAVSSISYFIKIEHGSR